jgi:polyribonucleotide nucleotidyltransferase
MCQIWCQKKRNGFQPDLDRYNMAIEQILQDILERLLAGQKEVKELTALQEEAAARQRKATAELKAAYEELEADLKATVAARTAPNQAEILACPEEMKVDVSSE